MFCIPRRQKGVLLFFLEETGRSRVILSGGVMNSAPVSGGVRQWKHEEVIMFYERGRSSFLPEDPPGALCGGPQDGAGGGKEEEGDTTGEQL